MAHVFSTYSHVDCSSRSHTVIDRKSSKYVIFADFKPFYGTALNVN